MTKQLERSREKTILAAPHDTIFIDPQRGLLNARGAYFLGYAGQCVDVVSYSPEASFLVACPDEPALRRTLESWALRTGVECDLDSWIEAARKTPPEPGPAMIAGKAARNSTAAQATDDWLSW